jgi:hypothetical protein
MHRLSNAQDGIFADAELEAANAACGGFELTRALHMGLAKCTSIRIQLCAAVAQDYARGIAARAYAGERGCTSGTGRCRIEHE